MHIYILHILSVYVIWKIIFILNMTRFSFTNQLQSTFHSTMQIKLLLHSLSCRTFISFDFFDYEMYSLMPMLL